MKLVIYLRSNFKDFNDFYKTYLILNFVKVFWELMSMQGFINFIDCVVYLVGV